MTTTMLILTILGSILLFVLIIAVLYVVALLRRTNIVVKKIDYLVEDITYKSESLNVAVESINKFSNYFLSFDTVSKKSMESAIKLLTENRAYIYTFIDRLKESVVSQKSTKSSTKKPTKKSDVKSDVNKTKTAKKPKDKK
ncbi:MAG: hypothetical protein GQ557_02780 [Mycoplasmataceae bacterium]|nr:hypothetical protein [Mycoplasmataceae bacterium]